MPRSLRIPAHHPPMRAFVLWLLPLAVVVWPRESSSFPYWNIPIQFLSLSLSFPSQGQEGKCPLCSEKVHDSFVYCKNFILEDIVHTHISLLKERGHPAWGADGCLTRERAMKEQ